MAAAGLLSCSLNEDELGCKSSNVTLLLQLHIMPIKVLPTPTRSIPTSEPASSPTHADHEHPFPRGW